VYYDPYPNAALEKYITDYGAFLKDKGEKAVTVQRLESVDEVLEQSDVSYRLLLHIERNHEWAHFCTSHCQLHDDSI
jgi:hypothetical protein